MRTASTGMIAMVVQFGLAIMPLGTDCAASRLASTTMRGTSGSLRQADELSTTVAPAAANRGAYCLEVPPPAENRAMSMPRRDSSVAFATSSTSMSWPRNCSTLPAERSEAKNR